MGAQRDLVIEVDVRVLMPFVAGESGCHQALFQLGYRRYMDRTAIQKRATSLFRREHFVAARVKDHAGDSLALAFQRNRNTKDGIAMGKVRGAIERVNIPAKVAAGFAPAALFANQVMIGPLLAYAVDNQLF